MTVTVETCLVIDYALVLYLPYIAGLVQWLTELARRSPGQQFMERLNAVCPVDADTLVLGLLFVSPPLLYVAGRVLLWDYRVSVTSSSHACSNSTEAASPGVQNRPSVPDPEVSKPSSSADSPSSSGSAYQWQSKPAPEQRDSNRRRRAAWAAEFVTRSCRWMSTPKLLKLAVRQLPGLQSL